MAIEEACDSKPSEARSEAARWFTQTWWLGLALLFALWLALLAVENLNHRFAMVDFQVFYAAGRRALQGQTVYRLQDGFYQYKYGPAAAFLFAPFTFLPLRAASIAYWILLAAVLTANLFASMRLAQPDYRGLPAARVNGTVLLVALAVSPHLVAELHLGQVNQVLLGLHLLMALAFVNRRPIAFGLAMAVSLYLKPFALVFVPYLLLKGRRRELAVAVLFTVVLGLAPLAAFGPQELGAQYRGWMGAIAAELAQKNDLLRPGNHTLFSIAVRCSPLRLLPLTPPVAWGVRVAILGALAALVVWFVRRGRALERPEAAEFGLLLSLVPLLACTSSNAYGAAMPALFVLFFAFGRLEPPWRAAVVVGGLLLGGNHWDLWGRDLFTLFENLSLVAVGTVLLVAALARGRYARAF